SAASATLIGFGPKQRKFERVTLSRRKGVVPAERETRSQRRAATVTDRPCIQGAADRQAPTA
ncbi:MAG: hypothetical protein ACK5PF_07150, partial [bacterium]